MSWDKDLEVGSPTHILASSDARTLRAVAGPGSGKSYAIQRAIARLLENGTTPTKILAVSFTRTAARDLKKDIGELEAENSELVITRTIHSHALSILMRNDVIERTGRKPRMILEHELKAAFYDIGQPEKYGDVRQKKHLTQAYTAGWATLQEDEPGFAKDSLQQDFETDLLSWMREHAGMLIGEVVPEAIKFLRDNPHSDYTNQFDVILVDEYQDLNKSEQEFIRLIRGDARLIIVGDDDQSIYGFKSANPEGIRNLEVLHGEYEDVKFNECRRCPRTVTRIASNLISHNPNRTLGELVPRESNPDGETTIVQWRNYSEEAPGIASYVTDILGAGTVEPKDILILSPRRKIGYKLRNLLNTNGVSVRSYFREDAIKDESVQRAFSLLNLLANPDDAVSLRFLLGCSVPQNFRASQYIRLRKEAANTQVTVRVILDRLLSGELALTGFPTITEEYRRVLQNIAELKTVLSATPSNLINGYFIQTEEQDEEFYELARTYDEVLSEVGLERAEDENERDAWFKDVFGKLKEKLSMPEIPNDISHVRIMSLHSSKGLSAKVVIVCSMVDELMPAISDDMSDEDKQKKLEEQRRLFYVAITRCKASDLFPGRLIISSFSNIDGKEALQLNIVPSRAGITRVVYATRFIRDLGTEAPRTIISL